MADYEHSSNYHKIVSKIKETNNLKDVEILKTKLRSLEQDDEVRELIEKCDERVEEIHSLIREEKYQKAISENAKPDADLDSLIKQFQEIEGYKDSSSILKSLRNEKEYRFLVKAFDSGDDWDWERICSGFEDLGDYKDSKKYFKASIPKRDQQRKEKELREKKEHEAKLESEYNEALSVMRQGYLMAASEKFRNLGDYKDAKEKAEECKKKQNEIEEGKNREKRITLLVIIGAVFLTFAVYLVICLTRWNADDSGHWHVIAGSTVGYSEHEYSLTQEVLPTCVEDGSREYVCDICGWHLTEQLKATGHTPDEGKVTKEPTCTEPGRRAYTCKTCGFVLKTEEVPATGHSLDEGEVTKAPTCTETGTKVYTCKTCGAEITESIPATGHDFNDMNICIRCGFKEPFYKTGDKGPAGGYVFYDKGDYSGGWRYLEAAPADLSLYGSGDSEFVFGYYRLFYDSENLFVNGTKQYNENNCTGTAIGMGKRNTELLVNAMGDSAYTYSFGSEVTSFYAAKLCSELVYNGYDDWFLPSRDELDLMFVNLYKTGLGGFSQDSYWSSSEYGYKSDYAWSPLFYNGINHASDRYFSYRVRAVRAF